MKNFDSFIVITLFYLGWFGSIFIAKTHYPWMALFFPFILLAYLIVKRQLSKRSILIAVLLSLLGVFFDSILVNKNFILIKAQTSWFIPLWLVSIWILFSFPMIKLGKLIRWPNWLSILLGFIFGPLSYKSGEAFEVLAFLTPWTFWIYAGFWAIFFPLVLKLSKKYT